MELKLTPFDKTRDLNKQRELFKDCFPETNGGTIQGNDHYNWKFHSFPLKTTSWEYAAYIGQEIVGYYAALPYQYKIGSKVTPVGMVCDVMTSSKYRGKGIFTKMGSYATSELSKSVPFTIGYPIRKEVLPGHLKVGWNNPFCLPLYIKFYRLNSFLRSKKIEFLAPFANLFLNVFNGIVKSRGNKKYSYSLFNKIKKIQDYDSFVQEWSKTVRNSLVKDSTFARWRYSAPEREYKFLVVRNKEKKTVGFVSFRKIVKEGIPSFGILDYMVLPDHKGCHGLINKVLQKCAREDGVEAVMTMMSRTSASKYKLMQNGFLKSPFVFKLIIKDLGAGFSNDELFEEKNWHLMWVDSDDL
ncbi:MAG: GNAT family N-acetyltransferase [Mangrovibacterium sp.]